MVLMILPTSGAASRSIKALVETDTSCLIVNMGSASHTESAAAHAIPGVHAAPRVRAKLDCCAKFAAKRWLGGYFAASCMKALEDAASVTFCDDHITHCE